MTDRPLSASRKRPIAASIRSIVPKNRAEPSRLFGNRRLSASCAASYPTGMSKTEPTGPPFTE